MTGLIPERRRVTAKVVAAAAPVIAALALSACASNTYGTGTSPGMQTLEDITGIAMLTGKKKDPIDYTPRPKIVLPPSTADLPPPQSDSATATVADWPNDPDAAHAKAVADADARAAAGQDVPQQYYVAAKPVDTTSPLPNRGPAYGESSGPDLTPAQVAATKKAFADAHGSLAVDANGNPVRKYLTDPPVDYRAPDPTQPLTVDTPQKKKKKFLWWTVDD